MCNTSVGRWGLYYHHLFHRHVLHPNQDLTDQDPKVVAIAQATWTPEVIEAYEAMVAEQELPVEEAE
jgi:hypothetical protein